jgi:hypothetical protein
VAAFPPNPQNKNGVCCQYITAAPLCFTLRLPLQPEGIAAVPRQFQAKIIATIFAFRVAFSLDLSYNEVNPNWRSIE